MRLIDADALKESMRGEFIDSVEERIAIREIESAPSIDIVRCAECKYKQQCLKAVQHTTHEPTSVTIAYRPIDFCSYAGRKDEPQTNADQHTQHVGSVESVEPTWTKEEHEAFYTFLWNVINPNEMQDYIGMFETNDEPQTATEIAKAIVHEMIDDAVIAEDAYPDLRKKMHEAVERLDEYYPSEAERSE